MQVLSVAVNYRWTSLNLSSDSCKSKNMNENFFEFFRELAYFYFHRKDGKVAKGKMFELPIVRANSDLSKMQKLKILNGTVLTYNTSRRCVWERVVE